MKVTSGSHIEVSLFHGSLASRLFNEVRNGRRNCNIRRIMCQIRMASIDFDGIASG